MDQTTKDLLLRWRSLESSESPKAIASRCRLLWFAGLTCCLVVVFGVMYGLHPAAIAAVAALGGWLVAEANALRSRLSQWPIFKQYINWQRVRSDLGEPAGDDQTH
jgi:hypothetical protein